MENSEKLDWWPEDCSHIVVTNDGQVSLDFGNRYAVGPRSVGIDKVPGLEESLRGLVARWGVLGAQRSYEASLEYLEDAKGRVAEARVAFERAMQAQGGAE